MTDQVLDAGPRIPAGSRPGSQDGSPDEPPFAGSPSLSADDSRGIRLDGVVKSYGSHTALDTPVLHVPEGSLTVFVGPSGCGKSTALRVIAGLESPDRGRVLIDGADVTSHPPGARDLSMVFQDFALYPHMTVEQNIGFSLRLEARHNRRKGPTRAQIAERVRDACSLLRIDGLEKRRPAQLSGGERQRVGLARAIVRRPSVLLLDEPLSALDAQLRQHARAELVRLRREVGATMLLVTHDQLEALSMGTHLVVLNSGKVAQAGTPVDVYQRPASTFVAAFVGSPSMNLHPVRGDGVAFVTPGLRATVGNAASDSGRQALLGWRPGEGRLIGADSDVPNGPGMLIEGVVDVVEFTGDGVIVNCRSELGRWAVVLPAHDCVPAADERLRVHVPASRLHLFDAAGGRRLPDAPGDNILG